MKPILFISCLLVFLSVTEFGFSKDTKNTPKKYTYLDPLKDCNNCKFDSDYKDNMLVYDFSCKQFYYQGTPVNNLKNVQVKHNELLRVAIINLNRYLYDVELEVNDVEYTSEMPALFNQLFLGNGNPISELINKVLDSPVAEVTTQSTDNPKSTKQSELIDKLKALKKKYDELNDKQLSVYQYCKPELNCCNDSVYKNTKYKYSEMSNDLLELKLLYKKYTVETDAYISLINKEIEIIKEKENEIEKQLKAKGVETTVARKDSIQKLIDRLKTETQNKEILAQELKAKETDMKISEEIWSIVTKISEEDLMKLILFTNNMVKDHYFFIAPPIYAKGNLVDIGIKIKPIGDSTNKVNIWKTMPLYSDNTEMSLFVRKKFYVSFSTGPFAAFGSSSKFAQQTYSWQQKFEIDSIGQNIVSDSSRYKLVESSSNRSLFGIGAFAHFGVRVKKNFGVAATTGVGVTFEKKPIPVYFLGGSLFMGADWHQFNISFGVALAQLKVKSGSYRDDVLYDSKPADIDYGHKLGVGGFISISYTLLSPEILRKNKSGSK